MNDKILREYSRYLAIQDIINLLRNPFYEIALEKVLVKMANLQVSDRKDEILLDKPPNHKIYNTIRNALSEYISEREIELLLKNIVKIIKKYLAGSYKVNSVKYGVKDNLFYCGRFEKVLSNERIDALKRKCIVEEDVDKLILICLLRYECIISRFQQWTMPTEWYYHLHKRYNVCFEGFSSPLNSVLLLLKDNSKIWYSSLFYDTDYYFGSLGNVFKVNVEELEKKYGIKAGVFVPSYIDVLEDTAEKLITKWQSKSKMGMILLTRKEKEVKGKHYVLGKGEWYFENQLMTTVPVKFHYGNKLNIYVVKIKESISVVDALKDFNNIIGDVEEYDILKAKMEKEYARYLVVLRIVSLNSNREYEWRNIVERFLNSMANVNNDVKRIDEVFINISLEHPIYKKMIGELNDKGIRNSKELAKRIHQLVEDFLNIKSHPKVDDFGRSLSPQGNIFYCGGYKVKLDRVRIMRFIERLGEKAQHYRLYILIALLRYETVLARGQNWNIPYNWYVFLHNEYGVSLEGFSSPFNSQLVLLSNRTNFCSLFPDTDGVFGSLGSLFDLDIVKYAEERGGEVSATLHPPYIPHILEKMVDLIERWLEMVPRMRLFVGFPNWKDYPLIGRLFNNRHLKYKKLLEKGDFYFENSMDESVKRIFPKNLKRWTFIFSNFEKDKEEKSYSEAIKSMKYLLK